MILMIYHNIMERQVSITFNPSTFKFYSKIKSILAEKLPKKFSSLKKSELLKGDKISETSTTENIIETIKMNLQDYFINCIRTF